MASTTYIANGTSQITSASTTDKVRIATTTPIAIAVGDANVTVSLSTGEIIPANTVDNNFTVGQGNYIAFIQVIAGTQGHFSITGLGAPHPETGTE